ncbi:uncharacterized protein [Nicotiana tomentosiformis]|uniref:uncharacterized protein n=1 Tax=Nicotiana tomentosiformis TaxID=4098 RepID=UPI00051BFA5F|nr:uncharacterized protein LOC104098506 [Nicotiana tomentosiformis]
MWRSTNDENSRKVVLILDELSKDANQWLAERNDRRKSVGVHQVDSNTSIQAQLDTMAKEIRKLTLAKVANLLSKRAPGTLSSHTEKYPKEIIKIVSLRSDKTLADLVVKARPEVVNKQTETLEEKKSEEQKCQISGILKEIEESRHMPALPFPQKMKREKLDKCSERFLEMLKQLYVNIPFTNVLTHMLAYAKFLKEIMSSKRKLEETIVVKLNAKLHHTMLVESEKFDKALYDSGASINLMPLSVFRRLEDMEVNKEVPLILGRPFLCTSRAILDIYEGQLMLIVSNEEVVSQMKRMMKYPSDEVSAYSCFKLDVVGELAEKYKFDKLVGDTLERCIT